MKIRNLAFLLIMTVSTPTFAVAQQEVFVHGEWLETELFFDMICTNEEAFKKKLASLHYYIVDETSLKETRYNLKVFLKNPQTQGELFSRLVLIEICDLVFQLQEHNYSCYALNETEPVDLSVAAGFCSSEAEGY